MAALGRCMHWKILPYSAAASDSINCCPPALPEFAHGLQGGLLLHLFAHGRLRSLVLVESLQSPHVAWRHAPLCYARHSYSKRLCRASTSLAARVPGWTGLGRSSCSTCSVNATWIRRKDQIESTKPCLQATLQLWSSMPKQEHDVACKRHSESVRRTNGNAVPDLQGVWERG